MKQPVEEADSTFVIPPDFSIQVGTPVYQATQSFYSERPGCAMHLTHFTQKKCNYVYNSTRLGGIRVLTDERKSDIITHVERTSTISSVGRAPDS